MKKKTMTIEMILNKIAEIRGDLNDKYNELNSYDYNNLPENYSSEMDYLDGAYDVLWKIEEFVQNGEA